MVEESLTNRSRSETYCGDLRLNTGLEGGGRARTRRGYRVVEAGNWVVLVPREIELFASPFFDSSARKLPKKVVSAPATSGDRRYVSVYGLTVTCVRFSGFNKRNFNGLFAVKPNEKRVQRESFSGSEKMT